MDSINNICIGRIFLKKILSSKLQEIGEKSVYFDFLFARKPFGFYDVYIIRDYNV